MSSPKKPFQRLETLARTMQSLQSDRPVYVTEFGVRKLMKIENQRPGSLDGVKMEHSPEAAFMTAWFSAMAPQRGCAGLVKWAFYRTDLTSGWGHWGMIDAPSGGFVQLPSIAS